MRLLLDTHVALWAIADERALLGKTARLLISDAANEVYVSAVSIWEIAIKFSLARGRPNDMPISGPDALSYFDQAGYRILPMTGDHAAAVQALPRHHADPFDRMLIAQAMHEPLRLLTRDGGLAAYGAHVQVV